MDERAGSAQDGIEFDIFDGVGFGELRDCGGGFLRVLRKKK